MRKIEKLFTKFLLFFIRNIMKQVNNANLIYGIVVFSDEKVSIEKIEEITIYIQNTKNILKNILSKPVKSLFLIQ